MPLPQGGNRVGDISFATLLFTPGICGGVMRSGDFTFMPGMMPGGGGAPDGSR
jgi:hypothetical protein